MWLKMKSVNIIEVHWEIGFLGGSRKTNICGGGGGDWLKKGLGEFAG